MSDWTETEFLSDLPTLVSDLQTNKKNIEIIQKRLDSLERNIGSNSDLEESIALVRKDIEELKGRLEKSTTSEQPKKPIVSLYEKAQQHFKGKEWKQAILIYEEFRKQNPKSDQFKTATLNIGLSFKNLDLKKEASIFLKEVIERFPNSPEAKTAKESLK